MLANSLLINNRLGSLFVCYLSLIFVNGLMVAQHEGIPLFHLLLVHGLELLLLLLDRLLRQAWGRRQVVLLGRLSPLVE